jgi:hypothetical protein
MLTRCEVLQQVTGNYRHRRLQGSLLFALNTLQAAQSTSLEVSFRLTSGWFLIFVFALESMHVKEAIVSLSNDFPTHEGNNTILHSQIIAFKSPQVFHEHLAYLINWCLTPHVSSTRMACGTGK